MNHGFRMSCIYMGCRIYVGLRGVQWYRKIQTKLESKSSHGVWVEHFLSSEKNLTNPMLIGSGNEFPMFYLQTRIPEPTMIDLYNSYYDYHGN